MQTNISSHISMYYHPTERKSLFKTISIPSTNLSKTINTSTDSITKLTSNPLFYIPQYKQHLQQHTQHHQHRHTFLFYNPTSLYSNYHPISVFKKCKQNIIQVTSTLTKKNTFQKQNIIRTLTPNTTHYNLLLNKSSIDEGARFTTKASNNVVVHSKNKSNSNENARKSILMLEKEATELNKLLESDRKQREVSFNIREKDYIKKHNEYKRSKDDVGYFIKSEVKMHKKEKEKNKKGMLMRDLKMKLQKVIPLTNNDVNYAKNYFLKERPKNKSVLFYKNPKLKLKNANHKTCFMRESVYSLLKKSQSDSNIESLSRKIYL